jgi:hypothetical protein
MTVSGLTSRRASAPAVPEAGQQDPEQAVGAPQTWTRRGALEDGQLVPQREVFERQGVASPEGERRPVRIRVSMLAILDEAGRKFNTDKLDGISRRDRRIRRRIMFAAEPGAITWLCREGTTAPYRRPIPVARREVAQ